MRNILTVELIENGYIFTLGSKINYVEDKQTLLELFEAGVDELEKIKQEEN